MDNFEEVLLKKVKFEVVLYKKIIDSINDNKDSKTAVLLDACKRVSNSVDEIVDKNINSFEDLVNTNRKIESLSNKLYGENNPYGNCCKYIISNCYMKKHNDIYEGSTGSLLEELYVTGFNIRIDKYKKLEGLAKKDFAEYIFYNITNSEALRDMFQGNEEHARKISTPENYLDLSIIRVPWGIKLTEYSFKIYKQLEELVKLKRSTYNPQDLCYLNNAILDEQIQIEAIYIQGRERNVDFSIPWANPSKEVLEIMKEACDEAQDYLDKKHSVKDYRLSFSYLGIK